MKQMEKMKLYAVKSKLIKLMVQNVKIAFNFVLAEKIAVSNIKIKF